MWSFLRDGLFDEFNIFVSSMVIGGKRTPTIAGGNGSEKISEVLDLKLKSVQALGNGVLLKYIKSNN